MFQKTVGRNFTTGFPGDIVRDGPKRAKPGRIVAPVGEPTATVEPGGVITRAFGYAGDLGTLGGSNAAMTTRALDGYTVSVGGANFFGILGHPKHYVLSGTQDGGTLAPSMSLPLGSEGEFFDMVTGLVVQLFNAATAPQSVSFGYGIAYVRADADATKLATLNPAGVPAGGLVAFAQGTTLDAEVFTTIPNARVMEAHEIIASTAGTPASVYAIVQLTQ
uniref:Virion structural protein n=1 Tax=Serratia phage Spe5P4 TaxID=3159438 RepID=A0AAU7VHQ3_9CAUD